MMWRTKEEILAEWEELKNTQCHAASCDMCYYRQLELSRQMKVVDPEHPKLAVCERKD